MHVVVRRCALIDVALCTITCFRTLIPRHVIFRPSTHYRSSYACIYISTFILVASRIMLAASRSSPLVYPLLTTHVFDTLVLRTMRIPCGFDVCVSLRQLHDFFASIDRRFSDYHNHRRCDFHWRLHFRPAIGPAILAPGFRLLSLSILRFPHQRSYRLHCASISACDDSRTYDLQSIGVAICR
jgi:hypothetical protein